MNAKILVTGGTGTIGSFVCDNLKATGADFTVLVRTREKANQLNEKGIKSIIGDLGDIPSMDRALEGIEKVFLLSSTSPQSPELQGNLVKLAKSKGIRHIVKVSAKGTDPDADFNIGRFHGQTEKLISDLGIPFTFLHPHSFMQNLLFDVQTIKEQSKIYTSMGDGKIPMVDARDIAAVALKALTESGHEGKTYIITGPEAISYHDIARELSLILGREILYIPIAPEVHHSEMLKAGMPDWLADDLVALNRIYAANKAMDVSPDVEKVTGRKSLSIKRFLEDFRDAFI